MREKELLEKEISELKKREQLYRKP